MTDLVHPYEKRGLGRAPFCVDHVVDLGNGGSDVDCDFCGHRSLRYVCYIHSHDSRVFKVGSECVKKANDEALHDQMKRQVRGLKIAAQEKAQAEVQQRLAAERAERERQRVLWAVGFSVGMRVVHTERGAGTVLALVHEQQMLKVEFDRMQKYNHLAYVAPATLTREGS